jgi:hypothetical protein
VRLRGIGKPWSSASCTRVQPTSSAWPTRNSQHCCRSTSRLSLRITPRCARAGASRPRRSVEIGQAIALGDAGGVMIGAARRGVRIEPPIGASPMSLGQGIRTGLRRLRTSRRAKNVIEFFRQPQVKAYSVPAFFRRHLRMSRTNRFEEDLRRGSETNLNRSLLLRGDRDRLGRFDRNFRIDRIVDGDDPLRLDHRLERTARTIDRGQR